MRKDIYERIKLMKKENIKVNYAKLARQFGCDYRTIKRYFEVDDGNVTPKKTKPSKLDPYREIIKDKLSIGCNVTSIYRFIKDKGYEGKMTILKDYCRALEFEANKKATIRFETSPGLQAQVDWKEKLTLTSRNGEVFTINIFLIILGYSRMKYFCLTLDRSQDTLIESMIDSFKYFGGVPKEILFDNMKTVVDHSKSNYQEAILNEAFYQFSKDMGFEAITCRPYRPQTKGKVENLAKVMDGLKVYNNEFESIEELVSIVNKFNQTLNSEVSQATREKPIDRFIKEKEHLQSLPNLNLLNEYLARPITRIVSKESMITYKYHKYSLDTKYIGKTVILKVDNDLIRIYLNGVLIEKHKISGRFLNYKKEHVIKIMKSDAFKEMPIDEIEKIAERNMSLYDNL